MKFAVIVLTVAVLSTESLVENAVTTRKAKTSDTASAETLKILLKLMAEKGSKKSKNKHTGRGSGHGGLPDLLKILPAGLIGKNKNLLGQLAPLLMQSGNIDLLAELIPLLTQGQGITTAFLPLMSSFMPQDDEGDEEDEEDEE